MKAFNQVYMLNRRIYLKRNIKFFSSKYKKPLECYYRTLNLSTDASMEEIKKEYLKLAKKYHPDNTKEHTTQIDMFKKVSEAYQVLSDPIKRDEYDSLILNRNAAYKSSARYKEFQSLKKYSEMGLSERE